MSRHNFHPSSLLIEYIHICILHLWAAHVNRILPQFVFCILWSTGCSCIYVGRDIWFYCKITGKMEAVENAQFSKFYRYTHCRAWTNPNKGDVSLTRLVFVLLCFLRTRRLVFHWLSWLFSREYKKLHVHTQSNSAAKPDIKLVFLENKITEHSHRHDKER